MSGTSRPVCDRPLEDFSPAKTSHRVEQIQSALTSRQAQTAKAVNSVLQSLASGTVSEDVVLSVDNAEESANQQLCPLQSLPPEFLCFTRSERPNPVTQERGKAVLDSFQALILSSRSKILPSQRLFVPQGTHAITGQSLPPLYNNASSIATGDDTATLSRNDCRSSFAFQVINNISNVNYPSPGQLNHAVTQKTSSERAAPQTPHQRQVKLPIGIKKKGKQIQINFLPPAVSRMQPICIPEIPRSAKLVSSILKWWIRPDRRTGLHKALVDWTSEERNYSVTRNDKKRSNRTLYGKRKTVAMSFFHFCDNREVSAYENAFTSLTKENEIANNLKVSCRYYKENQLATVFKEQAVWKDWTERVSRHLDVKAALAR